MMNRKGTKKRHGATCGYVVVGARGAMTACNGFEGDKTKLLYGKPVTIFATRKKAKRAIADTTAEDPEHGRTLYVMALAPLAN